MENIQKITIDIMNNKTSDYIYAKQFDKKREIRFTVTDNGQLSDIGDVYCTFLMKTADGYVAYSTPSKSEDARSFVLTLAAKHTIKSGKIPYQLTFTNTKPTQDGEGRWQWDNQNKIIGTVTSFMLVEPCVVDSNDIQSEYDTLSDEILQKLSDADYVLNEAQNLWISLNATSQWVVADTEPASSIQQENDFWSKPYN